MPNGDPNWGEKEYPLLEKFFGKIAETLETYAKQHNLKIKKYYHQSPSWSLLFIHPKGGVGRIDVARCQDNEVIVSPAWWIDNYEDSMRSLKEEEGIRCLLDSGLLEDVLEKMFRLILSWKTLDLCPGKEGEAHWWKEQWTKEEFEHLNDEYPIPKLD